MPDPATSAEEREENRLSAHYDARPAELTSWQRLQIPLIGWAGYWLVRLIGPTLKFEVLGWPKAQRVYDSGHPAIYAFWHRSILSAMWWWRQRGIVVLHSTSFDGQWIRRVTERFGFATALGSSSRGGLRGLVEMARRLGEGREVAFTIDGPRGPRYVAKPGPMMLARRTGHPVLVFHIALESAYTFEGSWDLFQIPHPFSRAVMAIAGPIHVPPDASEETLARKHVDMQAALDRVRDLTESWFWLSPEQRERVRAEWNR